MQKIAPKHEWVAHSINSMYPAGWKHKRPALFKADALTIVANVRQECARLIAGQDPFFVGLQVLFSGRYEPEDLLALEHVVPDRGAAHVNMKISKTLGHWHQNIFLHFGVLHFFNKIRWFGVRLAQMLWPSRLDPIELADHQRRLNIVLQFRVTELEADHVQQAVTWLLFVILAPVLHAEREAGLRVAVDHVDYPLAAHTRFDVTYFKVFAWYSKTKPCFVGEDQRPVESIFLNVFVIELLI